MKHIIPAVKGLLHGGDYNPEQWPKETWEEDMRLMGPVGFQVATIGVFSWSKLEPRENQFEFGWLDDIIELLDKNGRQFCLATPSAAMPAWLSKKYPEVLRVCPDGVRMRHGRRVNYCWSSPVYRELVRNMSELLAERYGSHKALAFWHVSNEYGGECHCSLCQTRFQNWLKRKFSGDLEALNEAYWTTYWSHRFSDWDELEIPGVPYGEDSIMGLSVDWKRFTSDQIVDFFLNESQPLRDISPNIPITTNLMGFYPGLDPRSIAPHLDFISWDSYPGFTNKPVDTWDWVRVAMSHDLNRSLKRQPFLLIESTPDSSNYYSAMPLKRPGAHLLEGAQAIAHGSEGVMYFQWRKCRGSSEQYHGAVINHDGTDQTRVYREVAELNQALKEWADVRGSEARAEVGFIYDWDNLWAIEATFGPRDHAKNYQRTVMEHYRPFWEAGVTVDVISSLDSFSPYRIIVAPMLYMLKPGVADRIRSFVADGGVFVMTYWSAMVDENSLNILGGFPGGLREVFGVWSEELDSLFSEQRVSLQSVAGNSLGIEGSFEAREYCERLHLEGAEALVNYDSEFYAGSPAVTRHRFGEGEAYFVGSRNDNAFMGHFFNSLLARTGLIGQDSVVTPPGVTIQSRRSESTEFVFVMNFTPEPQSVFLSDRGDGSSIQLAPWGIEFLTRSIETETIGTGPILAEINR